MEATVEELVEEIAGGEGDLTGLPQYIAFEFELYAQRLQNLLLARKELVEQDKRVNLLVWSILLMEASTAMHMALQEYRKE